MKAEAEKLFKQKFKEASGKDADETIMRHMSYCIDAMLDFAKSPI